MPSVLTRILRAAKREPGDKLNILVIPTHERYETGLALTGHNFFALQGVGMKKWNPTFAPVPPNYTILDGSKGNAQVPPELGIDLVLCQTRRAQFEALESFAACYNVPLICLEHVLPNANWPLAKTRQEAKPRGQVNVFISGFSRDAWTYGDDPSAVVVEHGVDTDLFRPNPAVGRFNHVLAVVNDWIRRDAECGYSFWRAASAGLPSYVVGDTPGLSEPARDTRELAFRYQSSRIFVNTAQVSPVPTTLLEAMSSGCAVISTRNPMIQSIINHGRNGYIVDTPEEMRIIAEFLLNTPGEAAGAGEAARQTILDRFSMSRFVSDWNAVFERAAGLTLSGDWWT